jgi:hypothetical protein
MIDPHYSDADLPFTHPFLDAYGPRPSNLPPIFDWEFHFALDRDPDIYQFLLARGVGACSSAPILRLRPRARMDKPAHLIREQDVYLLWLDDRRHLSETESRMCHRLPFTICARPIVRRAVFS